MNTGLVSFMILGAVTLLPSLARAHKSCAVNSNPQSSGYGKLFCSVFPDGGAAVNPATHRVSCRRGACAVNISPQSPGYQRVFCSVYPGGGAAVNVTGDIFTTKNPSECTVANYTIEGQQGYVKQ